LPENLIGFRQYLSIIDRQIFAIMPQQHGDEPE